VDEATGAPTDRRPGQEFESVERVLEDDDPAADLGSDVPHELLDAARAELVTPADDTDEG
jgi:hypothetical protein